MKRIILKSLTCLFLLGFAWSCSTDSDVTIDQPSEKNASTGVQQKDESAWEGIIGYDRGNGVYEITADEEALIADLEAILVSEENPVKLTTLTIQRKIATNNPNSEAYFIIGGTGNIGSATTSIGRQLTRMGNGFTATPSTTGGGIAKSVSCRGCGTGCFLEYYEIDGHFVPYCDSAGCGSDCTKSESK